MHKQFIDSINNALKQVAQPVKVTKKNDEEDYCDATLGRIYDGFTEATVQEPTGDYILLNDDKKRCPVTGDMCYRIQAVRDIKKHKIKAGTKGGYVAGLDNMGEGGWVDATSIVSGPAKIYGAAINNSKVIGPITVGEKTIIKKSTITSKTPIELNDSKFIKGLHGRNIPHLQCGV